MALMSRSSLEAHDLYRFYHAEEEETLALRGVSLRVEPGETVAVVGPSGSGKSTLLACLAGLDEPDGGYVVINGVRLTRRSESERAAIRARKIGIMLQSGNLFAQLTVHENVALQLRLAGTASATPIRSLLDELGVGHRAGARAGTISGGEAARAGLAVALAADPAVLLADEPTGEVDAETERRLLDVLRRRGANGGATVVVTHSDVLARWADRIIRLQDGRIVDE